MVGFLLDKTSGTNRESIFKVLNIDTDRYIDFIISSNPYVAISLEATEKHHEPTRRHVGNVAAIVLDSIIDYNNSIVEVFSQDFNDICHFADLLISPEYSVKGALLHDLGKIVASPETLSGTSKLTDSESRNLSEHPLIAYKIIKEGLFGNVMNNPYKNALLKSFKEVPQYERDVVARIAGMHHMFQGKNPYPESFLDTGDNISTILTSLAVAFSDGFEATRSPDRKYRESREGGKGEPFGLARMTGMFEEYSTSRVLKDFRESHPDITKQIKMLKTIILARHPEYQNGNASNICQIVGTSIADPIHVYV